MTPVAELMEIADSAKICSHAEFSACFDIDRVIGMFRERAGDRVDGVGNVLFGAVQNPDVHARVTIANELLDRGWPVCTERTGANELLLLFATRPRGGRREAPLVGRLIDEWCDPLALERRGDRPILLLDWSDPETAPILDEIFARPGMDLTRMSTDGQSVLRHLLGWTPRDGVVLDRVWDYLERQGQKAPRLGENPKVNFPV